LIAVPGVQVKKAMEVTHRLGGENYVFWGGREGYQSLWNTNVRRELDHFARFLRMAVDHKQVRACERSLRVHYFRTVGLCVLAEAINAACHFALLQAIGATYQLLIEPKPREPTKHQYDYDAQTVMGFLKHYGLDKVGIGLHLSQPRCSINACVRSVPLQHFKLNIEPNHTTLAGHEYAHDLVVSSKYQALGSVDANTVRMPIEL
jgi:xylose isomerase